MKKFYFLFTLTLFSAAVSAQTTWDGSQNNSWTEPLNWSNGVPSATNLATFDLGSAVSVTNVPNGTIGSILVTNNTNLTLQRGSNGTLNISNANGNTAVDLTVDAGSALTIGNNLNISLGNGANASVAGTLTINAGRTYNTDNANNLTTVAGIIDNRGTLESSNSNKLSFLSGATYIHGRDGGYIPDANWDNNAICNITGVTATMPTAASFDQDFGHFTWDCPAQTGNLSFSGELRSIEGNFTMANTGTGNLNLSISGGNITTTIDGDFIQTGGTLIMIVTSGTYSIDLNGNFQMTGGELRRNGGTCNFKFDKNGLQTFTKTGGTITGAINFSVEVNSEVDFGSSVLDGLAATFILRQNSKLITAHPDGLFSAGATGSIQVGGARTFSSSADYEFRGASTGVFTTTTNPQVRNLIINNVSGNVTLAQPLTVSAGLVLTDGELNTTTTNLLTLIDGATVSGASNNSFVTGPIQKSGNDAFVFPVGKSGTGYQPISISAVAGVGNTFTAEYIRQSPPNKANIAPSTGIQQLSDCEYWILDRSSGTTAVTLTLFWNANSPCGGPYVTEPATIRAVHYNTTTQQWDAASTTFGTGTPAAGSVSWVGLNNFSPFTLGTTSATENPLPVVFADVRAYEKNSGVQIEWSNLTEKDVDNYMVERSSDGTNYTAIAEQLPTSNQNDKADYNAFDATPLSGTSYYRIRAKETTGKIVYSRILSVNLGTTAQRLNIYPNPVTGNQVTVSLSNLRRGEYNLRVVNTAGQDIFKQTVRNVGSTITQTISLPSSVKPGVYSMIVAGEEYREIKMFIVQ